MTDHYVCIDCNCAFRAEDVERKTEWFESPFGGYNADIMVCPYCGSEDIYEAIRCESCYAKAVNQFSGDVPEHYYPKDDGKICKECQERIKIGFRSALKAFCDELLPEEYQYLDELMDGANVIDFMEGKA